MENKNAAHSLMFQFIPVNVQIIYMDYSKSLPKQINT